MNIKPRKCLSWLAALGVSLGIASTAQAATPLAVWNGDFNGYAKYVSDALGEVGALEMQEHYSNFVSQNHIDVTNMDSFRTVSIQEYKKQYERFPYEAFDNTFIEIYQRENLADLLLSYVRLHSDEILD